MSSFASAAIILTGLLGAGCLSGCGSSGDASDGATSGDGAGAHATSSGGQGGDGVGGGASVGHTGSGSGASTSHASASSSGTAQTSASSSQSSGSGQGGAGQGGGAGQLAFTTIFTIVMENHSEEDIVGSARAPYINSLIQQYGFASNYYDSLQHPSLLNYLWLISGSDQGAPTDVSPDWNWGFGSFPSDGDHLGKQLEAAGIKWRSYQDGMGTPCKLDNENEYVARHDPFLYFSDIQNDPQKCSRLNVDYAAFPHDLAQGDYRYMWITPNLIHDGHDRDPNVDPGDSDDYQVAIEQEDAWLSQELPNILASETYLQGGVVFITWDEGSSDGVFSGTEDHVAMIVISPKLKSAGFTTNTPLSHSSYLATIEDLFGFPRLGAAAGVSNMFEFFNP